MKKIFLFIAMLSAISSYGQSPPRREPVNLDSVLKRMQARRTEALGKPFPAFSVLINDKAYSNKELQGKTVFVNFWFAACPPCIDELDALNKLYDTFKSDSSFEFISFTFEDEATIASFRQKYHMEYRILSVTRNSCDKLNFGSGYPTNVLLDKNSVITYFKTGGEGSQKQIAAYFSDEIYPLIRAAL